MSGKSLPFIRPSFDTGHLLTFKTPHSAASKSEQSPAGSHVFTGTFSPGQSSARSSAAPSPFQTTRPDAAAVRTLRGDLTAGALLQKLLNDEHALASQSMNEVGSRRDISILKLSEMCSVLRSDLYSLEQHNAQLSAKLGASHAESQELRHQIDVMTQRETVFQQSDRQHTKLQKEHDELRSREQLLALSLKEAEAERDQALHHLTQSKLQATAASESARNASILMQAMETDLRSAERARQSFQESLNARTLERDALQQRLRELEVSR